MEQPGLDQFLPAASSWFEQTLGQPTRIQERSWEALKSGAPALISAPTGSGKTLAAFFSILDDLFRKSLAGNLAQESTVLYISPLKALSNDIEKNLRIPLDGIARELAARGTPLSSPIEVMVRTGDTTPAERARMMKQKPHIIVTTPESFYVMLTSERGRSMLSTVDTLIVDEIHAIVSSRRGSHLALSIERLAALTRKPLQRIGISATVKPLDRVAEFLGAKKEVRILDEGHNRPMDVKMITPDVALDAVMTQEGWAQIHEKLIELMKSARTTLIFVNNRRLCERLARQLSDLIGQDLVGAHHGSLAHDRRRNAEQALKAGTLKVMVATSSLELGIDIGSVDLVVQIASPRSIHGFLQRIGRAEHHKDGVSRAVLVPLTRDDLVECAALLRAIKQGKLEEIEIPQAPLDILAQQLVAELACRSMTADQAFDLVRSANPYKTLERNKFEQILEMLSDGYSLRFGRRSRYVFYDRALGTLEARRGARLSAITNGGAIADNFEYEVVLADEGAFLGTVHEDFAIESMAGDVFQLGNQFWKIDRITTGKVLVSHAPNSTPTMPFWIAEAPGRSDELSVAVSNLRSDSQPRMQEGLEGFAEWLEEETGLGGAAATTLFEYLREGVLVLGQMPTRKKIVLERFFDEAGDSHIVLHSPYGTRINRAWGLALRKRFCRKFNFELQAAATDDAVLFSLSKTHSFALGEVFSYLKSEIAEKILVQALLAAPMFEIRWRWNASRALAILRQYGSRRTPPQIQKSQAQDLVALVFPDQIACAENLAGDREVPDHPLVEQTIRDCLTEAMDLAGLKKLLAEIESSVIETIPVDTAAPSVFAHEIINARPYAFLDDAPLEERRTRAVRTDMHTTQEVDLPSQEIIDLVRADCSPAPRSQAECYDQLCSLGIFRAEDVCDSPFLQELKEAGRIQRMMIGGREFYTSAEMAPHARTLSDLEDSRQPSEVTSLESAISQPIFDRILRGHLETVGPVSVVDLGQRLPFSTPLLTQAMIRFENEGWLFQMKTSGGIVFCERSFLARLRHYQKAYGRRQEFTLSQYSSFLIQWQHAHPDTFVAGEEGLALVLEQMQGLSMSADAWHAVLKMRVADYNPRMLDSMFLSGRFVWIRAITPGDPPRKTISRFVPLMILSRANLSLMKNPETDGLSHYAQTVLEFIRRQGAVFFFDLQSQAGLFEDHLISGMKELVARGLLTADSLASLSSLFPDRKKARYLRRGVGIAASGRWSLLRENETPQDQDIMIARILLRRYGVIFRYLAEKEALNLPWSILVRTLRRLEMQGEIRGGRFIREAWGEQFAMPEALTLLKETAEGKPEDAPALSKTDPVRAVEKIMQASRTSDTTAK